jgi:hypothetical protein
MEIADAEEQEGEIEAEEEGEKGKGGAQCANEEECCEYEPTLFDPN